MHIAKTLKVAIVEFGERAGEHSNIRDREVHALGTGRRHNTAASPAMKSRPYCIGSTAKLRMSVMPFWTIGPSDNFHPSPPAVRRRSSSRSAHRPGRCPRPARIADRRGSIAGSASWQERKAALVMGVDQFVLGRRRLGEDPEAGEG